MSDYDNKDIPTLDDVIDDEVEESVELASTEASTEHDHAEHSHTEQGDVERNEIEPAGNELSNSEFTEAQQDNETSDEVAIVESDGGVQPVNEPTTIAAAIKAAKEDDDEYAVDDDDDDDDDTTPEILESQTPVSDESTHFSSVTHTGLKISYQQIYNKLSFTQEQAAESEQNRFDSASLESTATESVLPEPEQTKPISLEPIIDAVTTQVLHDLEAELKQRIKQALEENLPEHITNQFTDSAENDKS